jgi:hypothetical protein
MQHIIGYLPVEWRVSEVFAFGINSACRMLRANQVLPVLIAPLSKRHQGYT